MTQKADGKPGCNCEACQDIRSRYAQTFEESVVRVMAICPICNSKRCDTAWSHILPCYGPISGDEWVERWTDT
jgi:hypothetical protein